jgi:hypothetical protein
VAEIISATIYTSHLFFFLPPTCMLRPYTDVLSHTYVRPSHAGPRHPTSTLSELPSSQYALPFFVFGEPVSTGTMTLLRCLKPKASHTKLGQVPLPKLSLPQTSPPDPASQPIMWRRIVTLSHFKTYPSQIRNPLSFFISDTLNNFSDNFYVNNTKKCLT